MYCTYVNSLRVSWQKSRSVMERRSVQAVCRSDSRSYIQGDLQQLVLEATELRMPVFKPYPSQHAPYPDYAEFIIRRARSDTGLNNSQIPVHSDRHVPACLNLHCDHRAID